MFYESKYLYHGVPRLAYFWPNPNYAAAALVALIPFFWILRFHLPLQGRKAAGYFFIAGLELFWSLLIGWTCSRGALVAWMVALVVFGFIKAKSMRGKGRDAIVFWVLSAAFLFVALLATGSGNRFLDIADGDRSALNRLGIWANALKLIYAAPLTGWGAGNSGNVLLQWFEPIASNKDYAAVVGTYLHIGAEFGLPVLVLLGAILAKTLWIGYDAEKKTQGWRCMLVTAAVSGLIAFMTAGVFSTLWVNINTSGVAVVLTLLIWLVGVPAGSVRLKRALICLGVACLVGGGTYWCARNLARSGLYTVRKVPGGVEVTKLEQGANAGNIVLCVDKLVLGTFYGRPIRRMIEGIGNWRCIYVYTGPPKYLNGLVEQYIVFGPRVNEIPKDIAEQAILVCPLGVYSKERYGVLRLLILPEYDEFGYAPGWINGVGGNKGKLKVLGDVGQDCTGRVTDLIRIFLEERR